MAMIALDSVSSLRQAQIKGKRKLFRLTKRRKAGQTRKSNLRKAQIDFQSKGITQKQIEPTNSHKANLPKSVSLLLGKRDSYMLATSSELRLHQTTLSPGSDWVTRILITILLTILRIETRTRIENAIANILEEDYHSPSAIGFSGRTIE
jgi:hypothetical protein